MGGLITIILFLSILISNHIKFEKKLDALLNNLNTVITRIDTQNNSLLDLKSVLDSIRGTVDIFFYFSDIADLSFNSPLCISCKLLQELNEENSRCKTKIFYNENISTTEITTIFGANSIKSKTDYFFPDLLSEINFKTAQNQEAGTNTTDKKKFLIVSSKHDDSFADSFEYFLEELSKKISAHLFTMPRGM